MPEKNVDIDKHHALFHQVLGRLTTIRAALWQLERQDEVMENSDAKLAVEVSKRHAQSLVSEMEEVRDSYYELLAQVHPEVKQ